MARIARVIAPGFPHHITQRGNRWQATFFGDKDYLTYVNLMSHWCSCFRVEVWAYCLMPNHVHLIVCPQSEVGMRRAIGEVHRRYTRMVNFREGWRGHLWQGRFASFPMDESHLVSAVRYVELNPVRAGIVKAPGNYRWSSAVAHLAGCDNALVTVLPLLEMVGNWTAFLSQEVSDQKLEEIRSHERTGRPLGSESFVKKLEALLGRTLRHQKVGRKKKVRHK